MMAATSWFSFRTSSEYFSRILLLLTCYFTFEPITVRMRAIAACVFNQAYALFPNDFFKVTGRMARIVNTEIAFQSDCRFPQAVFVVEAAAGDSVNFALLKFRRFVQLGNLFRGGFVAFFV